MQRRTTTLSSHRAAWPLVAALLASCVAAALPAWAQEAAPVPVQQEPRHKTVLENDQVRVLEIRIPPGDKSLMHTHAHDAVHISVQGARIRETKPRGWWASTHDASAAGLTYYSALRGEPYTHAIENIDTRATHIVAVELLPGAARATVQPLALAAAEKIADNERVRVDRLAATALPALPLNAVVVALGGAQPGLVRWLPKGQPAALEGGQYIVVQVRE